MLGLHVGITIAKQVYKKIKRHHPYAKNDKSSRRDKKESLRVLKITV